MSRWRGTAIPFLLIALPLAVELGGWRWGELVLSLAVVGGAVVAFRRFPLLVVSLSVVGAVVPSLVLSPIATSPVRGWPFAAAAVFGYLAGRRLGQARPVGAVLAGGLLAGLPVGVAVDVFERGEFGVLFGLYDWFVLVLVLLLVFGLPWLAGRYRRQRIELRAAGIARVAAVERNRIAREMHDSLGHELGLVALRAAALEVAPSLDDGFRAKAGEVRAGIAAATERLHEIVGLLGEPEDTDLTALVARATAAGQAVDLTMAVAPPDAVAGVVYRVVREGLTNAGRHAPGEPVSVLVERGAAGTTVTVENGLAGTGAGRGNGLGLAALRAEVARLDAGVRDGRFVLTAVVPHDVTVPRSRERPRVWRLVRVPLAAAGVVVVLGITVYGLVGADNRLDDGVYERLYIGQPREDVDLPSFQILGDPERALPAPPRGADCAHYWATVQTDDRLFYRLCFVDGRLVLKETVPR
ncbi:sensor histidine kinase [Actinophytocola algeriensis]|uniref:histidine kinase n=1 Tax=Actinophytocola algeriensis TaxID=1768010 RepID=A0A7W7VH36_9PSEU|nr:histidine kinase [Actinophytocola algeriensis]MBB4909794.1 signal transduction histidine kinase [Actinophytocola algeriensis]MBE1475784.1 signal transduction histidine kinase [Actinophytocola algeriensis]